MRAADEVFEFRRSILIKCSLNFLALNDWNFLKVYNLSSTFNSFKKISISIYVNFSANSRKFNNKKLNPLDTQVQAMIKLSLIKFKKKSFSFSLK